MLAVAKNEIGEAPSERVKVVREAVVEPVVTLLGIRGDCIAQIWNNQPDTSHGFKNSEALVKKTPKFVIEKMLEHVGRVDRVNRLRSKGKAVPHVQPKIGPYKGICVYVEEACKVLGSAAQVQMNSPLTSSNTPKKPPRKIVGKRSFGNTPKGNVFIALMKQVDLPIASSYCSSRNAYDAESLACEDARFEGEYQEIARSGR